MWGYNLDFLWVLRRLPQAIRERVRKSLYKQRGCGPFPDCNLPFRFTTYGQSRAKRSINACSSQQTAIA